MGEKMTTLEFAESVGLSRNHINRLIRDCEIEAEKRGRDYFIDKKFVDIIKNRPERRGRKAKKL